MKKGSTIDFLDSIKIERKRRILAVKKTDQNAFKIWKRAIRQKQVKKDKSKIELVYNFAKSLHYKRQSVDNEIYFCHPLRVATMASLSSPTMKSDLAKLGLLHNVLEVTNLTKDILKALFGDSITKQIINLTVNRKREWNADYKKSYYDKLKAGPKTSMIIKIFDKLDNLFIIGLNSNNEIRNKYLDEVQTFILPMTKKIVPSLFSYMNNLLEDSYLKGYYGNGKE